MTEWWRGALGAGRAPSDDQVAAITAPPAGRHSVNAGAGTGKTSTLALRALYLIEAGHFQADQIVVITFTRKAAAEVGARIADTLDRAVANGARLSGTGPSVYCTTIHALAAEILREFAFEAGTLTPPRAISDGEAYGIFHTSFRALLAGGLAVDATAMPIAELPLDGLERDLAKLALRLKNHGITPGRFESNALFESDRLARQSWGQLWKPGAGRSSAKRTECAPKTALTPEQRTLEAERERANIRVVAELFCDFDRRLAERNAATYGDLIGNATRGLGQHPALTARLRARWRYVLLDESQDTSESQLAFIECLFGCAGEADAAGMMPVGDTRQAIYGFNGADEHVMERIAAGADVTHPLVRNRRSPQEIVDAGQAVLQAAGIGGAAPLEASAGSAGLRCVRVQNFGVAGESIKDHVALESAAIAREIRRLLRDEQVAASDIAILVRRRTHAAAYVRALNQCGVVAALDRRSGLFVADEIRDALAWMSLSLDLRDRPAAARILQSPLCGLSDAAMVELTERNDWLEALLRDGAEERLGTDVCRRLESARTLLIELLPAAALPLRAAMARISATLPIAAGYVRIDPTVGAQAVINLRSLEELATSFAAERPGARLRDFADDVRRRILYDDDPQEPELELDGVRVLTIHQAKGLEWPFVFVACSTKNQYGTAEPSDSVVKYDLGSGAFALKNDIDGRETLRWIMLGNDHDPESGQRRAVGARKAAAEREQARVFYVALTRARRRVYVTAPVPSGKSGDATHVGAIRGWAESIEPGCDLAFDLPADGDMPADMPLAGGAQRALTARAADAPASVSAGSWFLPRMSYSALAAFETCRRSARLRYRLLLPDLRAQRPRFVGADGDADGAPGNAARLGSLTHRALELWGRAVIGMQLVSIDDACASAQTEFADATPGECEQARARARHAVAALAGYTIVAVETPFEIAVGATQVEGVIDVIARDPAGRILVIDYKTGRTDDEHYALQLALYRRVAEIRYPATAVEAAILRLTPDGAEFAAAAAVPHDALDCAIAAAGRFEDDTPSVGPWCDSCSYRGSPCLAPIRPAMRAG